MTKHTPSGAAKSQRQKFVEAARKAGTDESEEAFEAKLRKIAKAKPKDEPKK